MSKETYKAKKYWITTNKHDLTTGVVKVINDSDFTPTTEVLEKWLGHYSNLKDQFYPLHNKSGGFTREPFNTEEWIAFRYIHIPSEYEKKVNPLRTYYVPSSWFRDYAKPI